MPPEIIELGYKHESLYTSDLVSTDFSEGEHERKKLFSFALAAAMAAAAVREAKKRYPEVQLMLVLPYHPAIRPIEKPDGYDSTYYPWEDERVPKRLAIVKTNQHMVDTCDYLIAYAWHCLGGSGQIVEYARKWGKRGLIHIENLAKKLRENAI